MASVGTQVSDLKFATYAVRTADSVNVKTSPDRAPKHQPKPKGRPPVPDLSELSPQGKIATIFSPPRACH